jgi:hypothetical protein
MKKMIKKAKQLIGNIKAVIIGLIVGLKFGAWVQEKELGTLSNEEVKELWLIYVNKAFRKIQEKELADWDKDKLSKYGEVLYETVKDIYMYEKFTGESIYDEVVIDIEGR